MQEFDDDLFRTSDSAIKTYNEQIIHEFRANDGKVGGIFEGFHVLLLTTMGAKTGQRRLTPLAYFAIDGALIVVGSRGGAPSDPAWVHNLRADPRAEVEAGVESFDVIGRETPRDERDRLFDQIVALAPQFAVYQSRTTRVIPVLDLQRRPMTSA